MTAYIKSKEFQKNSHNHGLAILVILIILAIFCSVLFYAFQSSSIISYSYKIREKKQQLEELQAENHNLNMEIAQWRSLANLEELAQSLDMVEAEQVIYLRPGKEVAVKK
ncbi:MAG: hypothetical protein AVO34_01945 [Firmicutes bacterium ML8_F2]|jgi:cell division protein FtsB|nr:MAG: hypothetical protein AVO34_01945 [Firmicutes bacterium ML8_F2]